MAEKQKEKKVKKEKKEPRERTAPNPLPYIIVFAILFIIACILLSWVLYNFNKESECGGNQKIWCTDNFGCTNACNGDENNCTTTGISADDGSGNSIVTNKAGTVNTCFCQNKSTTTPGIGVTNISSCIFGDPTGSGAQYCNNPPNSEAGSCQCSLDGAPNCFNGCATNAEKLPTTNCCKQDAGVVACPLAPGNTG